MSKITRIILGTNVLEQAMGMPAGVRIARIEMGQEQDVLYIWVASELEPTPITVKQLGDLGKGFLPREEIHVEMVTTDDGNKGEVRGNHCGCGGGCKCDE